MELQHHQPPAVVGTGKTDGHLGDCMMAERPEASHKRSERHGIRMELRKSVRFVQENERKRHHDWLDEEATYDEDTQDLAAQFMNHSLDGSEGGHDREYEYGQASHPIGLTITANHSQSMPQLSHQLRSTSFSQGGRSRMVPCSPPVPIPQSPWKRRNSASTAAQSVSSLMLIPSHDNQYSRSQCEARLWDEYWNYKLSLESRESFQASRDNQQGDSAIGSSINQPHKIKPRTDSEASTEGTNRDSGDDGGEASVFDMDDF